MVQKVYAHHQVGAIGEYPFEPDVLQEVKVPTDRLVVSKNSRQNLPYPSRHSQGPPFGDSYRNLPGRMIHLCVICILMAPQLREVRMGT